MANAEHEAVMVHLNYLRAGQDQTNAHLKELNGRTRKVEIATESLEQRFTPVQRVVYGMVAAVLVSVLGALLALVMRG